MLSGGVTSRKPGSGSDWLPCKFIRPTFGVQNLNPLQEKAVAEFLSGGDVFESLPTGYGKPLIYHMALLVSGD